MPTSSLRCPSCGKRIVQQGDDGKLKIRTSILAFKKGQITGTVVCPHCSSDVDLDVRMGPSLLAELDRPTIRLKVAPKKTD